MYLKINSATNYNEDVVRKTYLMFYDIMQYYTVFHLFYRYNVLYLHRSVNYAMH